MSDERYESLEDFADKIDKVIKLLEEQNRLLKALTRSKQPYANNTGRKRG